MSWFINFMPLYLPQLCTSFLFYKSVRVHFCAPSAPSRSPRFCETFLKSCTIISPKYFHAPCDAWKSYFTFFFHFWMEKYYIILYFMLFLFTSSFSYSFVSAPHINQHRMVHRGAAGVAKEGFKWRWWTVEVPGDGKQCRTRSSISSLLSFMRIVHNFASCIVTL